MMMKMMMIMKLSSLINVWCFSDVIKFSLKSKIKIKIKSFNCYMYIKLREKEKERDRDRERKENNFYLSCGCIIFKCNILW